VLELLEAGTRVRALEAERFRRIEAWRDRLIAEGEPALAALAESHPLSPDQHANLTKALRRARRIGGSEAQRATAARELFRTLRGLLATRAPEN
jgi:ribosome-associated protein